MRARVLLAACVLFAHVCAMQTRPLVDEIDEEIDDEFMHKAPRRPQHSAMAAVHAAAAPHARDGPTLAAHVAVAATSGAYACIACVRMVRVRAAKSLAVACTRVLVLARPPCTFDGVLVALHHAHARVHSTCTP